jgi:cephalosporin hydroxylase
VNSLLYRAGLGVALIKLKLNELSCRTPTDYVDLASSWSFYGRLRMRLLQKRLEIVEFLKIVSELKPSVLLEIGTAAGGTLYLFPKVAQPNALIISVDLPGGTYGGGYPERKIPFYKSFARDRQRIELVRADSHNPETLQRVKDVLGDRRIDLLFIDGDHTYEGVKKDFELYSPLVRLGGIVALHDIVRHPPETGAQVNLFYDEIKETYPHKEIVENWNQGWAGIGIIFMR